MPFPDPLSQSFALAFRYHQAGRLVEAAAIYRQILAANPRHAEALHLLGAMASQMGRHEEAVTLIRQAIEVTPNDAAFHYNLGFALRELGRVEECVVAYQRAVEIKPDYAMAHNNLGTAWRELGQPEAALAEFQQALWIAPDCALAHNNAGNVLREQGRLPEAIAAYRQAIHFQLDYAEAHSNLGVACSELGELDAAVAAHQQSLRLRPNSPEGYYNLGIALSAQGRLEETVAAFRHALALKADFAEGYYNLGLALAGQGHPDDAVAAYRRALALKPGLAGAWNNLGTALKELGEVDAALDVYRRALALQPSHSIAHSNLLLTLHCGPDIDADSLFREHCRWEERHARALAAGTLSHPNDPAPERRLRIGYVSADFRNHAVAAFIEGLLTNHDPVQVEVLCYAHVSAPDDVTARLQSLVPHWRDVARLGDAALADTIRRDAIDILVDLSGHTADHRLLVFARKPAPVQVTYLGYCDTTGMPSMNYRLTDVHADPPGVSEPWHTEEIFRLAGGAWCFRPPGDPLPVQLSPAMQSGQVTFGCFNTLAKLTERHARLWAQILERVPGSKLLLKNTGLQNASARQRTLAMLEKLGVARDRVEMLGRTPTVAAHLETHGRVDIALDTFPYHGTTTTCEALWMGVPVVTLAGQSHVSRVGVSLLSNLGMPAWIAHRPEDYVQIAAGLAADLPALAALREQLRPRLEASPLMDGPRLARAVEQAFREMWRAWCATGK